MPPNKQQQDELKRLKDAVLKTKLITENELCDSYIKCFMNGGPGPGLGREPTANANNTIHKSKQFRFYFIILITGIIIATPIVNFIFEFILGIRCFVPNNYMIWEATRPISDCKYCQDLKRPIILPNLTREEFSPYAYSQLPIIIKGAVEHWPAKQLLNFEYLKNLYSNVPGALDSFNDECQFLHFESKFFTLKDVFRMPRERVRNGKTPWYVGFSNCHPIILGELRKLYPRPHFLPIDAEIPNTDYIFFGYDQGAVMHLDYIPRLMWQAQLRGNKTWLLAPAPECDHICEPFSFYVEPGDAVLIDTRIWYHATSISKGEFSLTIQSEYG